MRCMPGELATGQLFCLFLKLIQINFDIFRQCTYIVYSPTCYIIGKLILILNVAEIVDVKQDIINHSIGQKSKMTATVFPLIFFDILARKPNLEKLSIYSNKFFNNFQKSESSFACPGLQTSGLAQRLLPSQDIVTHKNPIAKFKNKCLLKNYKYY